MLNVKFILGVIAGMLIIHFHYKKKYNIGKTRIDKIKSNITEYLESEGIINDAEYNAEDVAEKLVDKNTEVKKMKEK